MSVKDYRRRIEREVEQARALADEPVLDATTGDDVALESIGAAGGLRHREDVERARALLHDKKADHGLRAAALAGVMQAHSDPATAHEHALERLRDGDETVEMRRAALHMLKESTFHSPSTADWRPEFLDAVRALIEVDDPALRIEALEVLVAEKDPFAQQKLIDGLRNPDVALVPVEDALYLLAQDIHAEAQEVAAAIADDPPSKRARLEALHILAADPGATERFAGLLVDAGEDAKVRRLAATALSSLAPERFRAVAEEILTATVAEAVDSAGEEALRLHTEALLGLDK